MRMAGSLLVLIGSLAGCAVGVPTKPDVEIERCQPVMIDEASLVSVSPRVLLQKFTKAIEAEYPRIELIDGLTFRDAAFPEGGWQLRTLLDPRVSARVSELLNVDYLVLVNRPQLVQGEEEGFFFPLLVGAMSVEGTLKISALIVDLRNGEVLTRLDCQAQGTSHIYHYVIFIAGNEPMLGPEAIKKLAREIGKAVTELKHAPRVALLAVEKPVLAPDTEKAPGEQQK